MEFKGTKGKWEVNRESACRISIIDGKIDVWSFQDEGFSSVEEMKANAQLISKSPEMLEMLKRILHEYQTNMDLTGNDIQYEIEQLIKEATI